MHQAEGDSQKIHFVYLYTLQTFHFERFASEDLVFSQQVPGHETGEPRQRLEFCEHVHWQSLLLKDLSHYNLLQSAQMYNLYIDTRVIDEVEYLQLFDRSLKLIEPEAPVSEPETPASEPEEKVS